MKPWPLPSLFFQLDRKTGGRKRREGKGGGYNLFGINCTMKSLFSGPACCSSLCVRVCVYVYLSAVVVPDKSEAPTFLSLQMAAVTADGGLGKCRSGGMCILGVQSGNNL